MLERGKVLVRAIGAGRTLAAFVLALMMVTVHVDSGLGRQGTAEDGAARVRIIHGLSAAGPIDVYVDGSIALIGMSFGETSGALNLDPGEHQLAVTPSGARADEALVAGTIALQADTLLFAPVIGTTEAASVGLFTVDERALEQGRSRFRIISGVPDGEGLVPAFTGGEALTPPLGFGDASEYASIDAGTYDLDVLDVSSGTSLLTLPAVSLAEGMTTDIVLIGQVANGSLTAIVETTVVETAQPVGLLAQIVAGPCADLSASVADLGVVRAGQGAVVGVPNVAPVAQGYGLAAISFNALVSAPHSVVVTEGEGTEGAPVTCGAIGGQLTDTGALVISLQGRGSSGASGVAVLAPGFENPETTGVSIFLTTEATAGAALPEATPAASNG